MLVPVVMLVAMLLAMCAAFFVIVRLAVRDKCFRFDRIRLILLITLVVFFLVSIMVPLALGVFARFVVALARVVVATFGVLAMFVIALFTSMVAMIMITVLTFFMLTLFMLAGIAVAGRIGGCLTTCGGVVVGVVTDRHFPQFDTLPAIHNFDVPNRANGIEPGPLLRWYADPKIKIGPHHLRNLGIGRLIAMGAFTRFDNGFYRLDAVAADLFHQPRLGSDRHGDPWTAIGTNRISSWITAPADRQTHHRGEGQGEFTENFGHPFFNEHTGSLMLR